MNLRPYRDHSPELGQRVYVDSSAVVIGQVSLADDSAIWPTVVVRGDVNYISIGKRSNIQDGCVLHVSHEASFNPGGDPLIIGDDVTVGHRAVLHGCTIENECLIGINTVILDKAIIRSQVLIGANSLVPPGKELESGYLYVGSPVKQIRPLTADELAYFKYSANNYVQLKDEYLA